MSSFSRSRRAMARPSSSGSFRSRITRSITSAPSTLSISAPEPAVDACSSWLTRKSPTSWRMAGRRRRREYARPSLFSGRVGIVGGSFYAEPVESLGRGLETVKNTADPTLSPARGDPAPREACSSWPSASPTTRWRPMRGAARPGRIRARHLARGRARPGGVLVSSRARWVPCLALVFVASLAVGCSPGSRRRWRDQRRRERRGARADRRRDAAPRQGAREHRHAPRMTAFLINLCRCWRGLDGRRRRLVAADRGRLQAQWTATFVLDFLSVVIVAPLILAWSRGGATTWSPRYAAGSPS